jgi:pyrroline-5-carboxylate reductase
MSAADHASDLPDRIAFIGGGNMARSLIGGLRARGMGAERIAVAEPVAELRDALGSQFGVRTTQDNVEAADGADLLVLAVKPQAMQAVCNGLAPLSSRALFVSIAAGITCRQIANWLGGEPAVVRCMPNTPALLGAGATGLFSNPQVTAAQRAAAAAVLAAVGVTVQIDDEGLMDVVTAVSGSGPAYVFLLAEAMQQAALANGLPSDAARTLVQQTLLGAARMLSEGDEPADVLRRRVTSPNGTTQAAIEAFERGGFHQLVRAAIDAATRRGVELAQQNGH